MVFHIVPGVPPRFYGTLCLKILAYRPIQMRIATVNMDELPGGMA